MTLEEAINHCDKVATELRKKASLGKGNPDKFAQSPEECLECAKEHEQLANWLNELRNLRLAISYIEREMQNDLDSSIDEPNLLWEAGYNSCCKTYLGFIREAKNKFFTDC